MMLRCRPSTATAGRSVARFTRPLSSVAPRYKSSLAAASFDIDETEEGDSSKSRNEEIRRLTHLRNVGILAHVDAGKTTVTERMLALAGIVRRAGSVDDGNTVTDYLPAERERGITIQSAAISFDWKWHNSRTGDDFRANDNVKLSLIDTPGHVDFSVEVSRSVAVLDGAVLVVDAVAGSQAQTETVWRAISRPSVLNNKNPSLQTTMAPHQDHAHEPLPCLALINKMDKEGCNFRQAIASLRYKLPGCNPVPIQMPLFRTSRARGKAGSSLMDQNIVAESANEAETVLGEFVGLVDLIHMRAVLWPEASDVANVEQCAPTIIPLLDVDKHQPRDLNCPVTRSALAARAELVGSLAEVDEAIEEYFLTEEEPSNAELRAALRRATLSRQIVPVMAGAALKGRGIEPLLDCIADLLPSPLDRMPPALSRLHDGTMMPANVVREELSPTKILLGHPLHPSLLAFAFKVVHMKGRGGSGDGRVVFARVYSGQIVDRAVLQVISPPLLGEAPEKPRTERVGGMLELAGGRFDNLEGGVCRSGDVCALIGLKSVVTGDTIMLASEAPKSKKNKKKSPQDSRESVCLAGVASPKPVLTVRLEAESSEQQSKLSEALSLLAIEDPSLVVEETDSATLLSGLGELHIEVTLDRVCREHGIRVMTGPPAVAYRETISAALETPGLLEYDRTIGATRLQASVHVMLEPIKCEIHSDSSCVVVSEPIVKLGPDTRMFLNVDDSAKEEDLMQYDELVKALIQGCEGALKRGPLGSYPMSNVRCHVVNIDAEGGLQALQILPGSLRAAAANAVSKTLSSNRHSCIVLEPTMSVEITLPGELVGTVLSDLSGRRGSVGDVMIGDVEESQSSASRALVRGEVPLVEILGYAGSLRSLTGGEAAFTAEYRGHSPWECQF
jgi:elongation factor G